MEPTFYKAEIETDDFNNFQGFCVIYKGFYYNPTYRLVNLIYQATANEKMDMNDIFKIFHHKLERFLEIAKKEFPNLQRGIQ